QSKSLASSNKNLRLVTGNPSSYDIFINHRGIDTKRTIAGLLFSHLSVLGYHPFLDSKSMKPGDKLFESIDPAIKNCSVGVAVFSPNYCDSYFCLHELTLMIDCKKKVVPIFCDVKPSELQIKKNCNWSIKDVERFQLAIEECKYTVGIAFDPSNGDWAEFLTKATDAIVKSLIEAEEDENKYYDGNSSQDRY
ncbi:probable 2' cyclic ADP-D-ribose synthase BdTIR, partial [Spinacia oleracea]|uniref:Probable 2' cyclic ADP-D-ribose synthase BdTIR n=1 Tax=Spinacia oleracea TaxID=3562 RepID=A0ABM3QXR6_SPIOL